MDRPIEERRADLLKVFLWFAAGRMPSPRAVLMSTCGEVATAVGMGPLKGMSREMIFVRSGLALGLISAVNQPLQVLGENHGMGDGEASDAATANFS